MKISSSSRTRWMLWGLLLTFTLCAVAWLDDSGENSEAATENGHSRRPRHPVTEASPAMRSDTVATAASRLERALERLELPQATKVTEKVTESEHPDKDEQDKDSPDKSKTTPGTRAEITAEITTETHVAPPVDLLAARTWYVPPPPPPAAAPKAPPLPFKVIGRIIEADEPVVFLSNQNRNLIARNGEKIDNTYLVERIDSAQMTFIYLPLAERQILTLGAVN